jgi:hypothetical protein
MIHCVGKSLIRRRLYTLLGRNNSTEDGYVEHFSLPWNGRATVTRFDSESEQLTRRDQTGNPESLTIESEADDVSNDTEKRIVIQIESVRFPAAHRVLAPDTSGEDGEMG